MPSSKKASWCGMRAPQARQRPRRTRYDTTGTLSYGLMGAEHVTQCDEGDTSDSFAREAIDDDTDERADDKAEDTGYGLCSRGHPGVRALASSGSARGRNTAAACTVVPPGRLVLGERLAYPIRANMNT